MRAKTVDFGDVEKRFGLTVRTHRIGLLNLHLAEVERVDELIREIYPEGADGHGDAPVWMITWPAALGLAEHLALQGAAAVAGASVLELGCGTAAPGIAAGLSGAARVVSTDCHALAVELARHNGGLNGCTRFEARCLDWFEPELDERFDWVVGSEVVYFEKTFRPLLSVLVRHTKPGGRILLSDPGRPQMSVFLEMCRQEGFALEESFRNVHLCDRSHRVRITLLTRWR
ncbi:MAG: 50S ribosomal protein L11 methyltransferase [bacterium]